MPTASDYSVYKPHTKLRQLQVTVFNVQTTHKATPTASDSVHVNNNVNPTNTSNPLVSSPGLPKHPNKGKKKPCRMWLQLKTKWAQSHNTQLMVDTTVFVSMQSGTVINLLKLTPRCTRISEGAAINGIYYQHIWGEVGGGGRSLRSTHPHWCFLYLSPRRLRISM